MKNSPITNFLGIICMLFGFGLFILPIFFLVKKDFTEILAIPIGFILGGFCLLLIPDKVILGLTSAINIVIKCIGKKADKE